MVSTSMTLNGLKLQKWAILLKKKFAIFGCIRMSCDEMGGDRRRLAANRNCCKLSPVSWALAQISCWSVWYIHWNIENMSVREFLRFITVWISCLLMRCVDCHTCFTYLLISGLCLGLENAGFEPTHAVQLVWRPPLSQCDPSVRPSVSHVSSRSSLARLRREVVSRCCCI